MPRPRRNSSSPSSRSIRNARRNGVGLDVEDGGEVFGGWDAFSRFGLSVGDRASDLGGDLLVEIGGVGFVYLDISQHDASNSSAIVPVRET